METYYYLYKITNCINQKIYIGVHKTSNLDDGYMGSGTILKHAIKKYGIENFEKEILQYFDSTNEMFEAESYVVNEEFVKDITNYNIKEGGHGGWDFVNDNRFNTSSPGDFIAARAKLAELRNNHVFNLTYKYNMSKAMRKYFDNNDNGFKGKHHTNESKIAIGNAAKLNQTGSGNSQFGKMWIYNEDLKESKRISKDDQIPDGWKKGRKIKFN